VVVDNRASGVHTLPSMLSTKAFRVATASPSTIAKGNESGVGITQLTDALVMSILAMLPSSDRRHMAARTCVKWNALAKTPSSNIYYDLTMASWSLGGPPSVDDPSNGPPMGPPMDDEDESDPLEALTSMHIPFSILRSLSITSKVDASIIADFGSSCAWVFVDDPMTMTHYRSLPHLEHLTIHRTRVEWNYLKCIVEAAPRLYSLHVEVDHTHECAQVCDMIMSRNDGKGMINDRTRDKSICGRCHKSSSVIHTCNQPHVSCGVKSNGGLWCVSCLRETGHHWCTALVHDDNINHVHCHTSPGICNDHCPEVLPCHECGYINLSMGYHYHNSWKQCKLCEALICRDHCAVTFVQPPQYMCRPTCAILMPLTTS
jgi:hypothetical protein